MVFEKDLTTGDVLKKLIVSAIFYLSGVWKKAFVAKNV